ncbi:hypothetical protein KSF_038640 [Reticulibacter mediterranei]|uniref:MalT-like TPR region domain-containing protein n=1 Tax=Reticulibacter mediterranei TaxID=2778369 RepID=A0A8J3IR12_9CHLR|nr:hypothetical protein [Reticulibacter mediterranei]GHO93816.1 hypothetical protein KSF_038640 [Reticulibacter mediterranei]
MNLFQSDNAQIDLQNRAHHTIHSMLYIAAQTRLNLAQQYQAQYSRLDTEFANLRSSFDWLIGLRSEEAAQLLNKYIEVLTPYLQQRGLQKELLRWCEATLSLNTTLQRKSAQLLLLNGQTQYALGEWSKAKDNLIAAAEASKQDDMPTYARALLDLGRLQFNQGDYEIAFQTMKQVEPLLQETNFEQWAAIRAEVAAYHLNREELDAALAIYLEIYGRNKQQGTNASTSHILLMLGVVYRRKKDYAQAHFYLEQLLKGAEIEQSQGKIATAAHHLAWVYLDERNILVARKLCGRAITHYEAISDQRGISDSYEQLGCIALTEQQGEEALIHLQKSLTMRRQLHNQQGIASSLRRIAIAHLILRHVRKGLHYLWQSLVMYHSLKILTRQQLTETFLEFVYYWRLTNHTPTSH